MSTSEAPDFFIDSDSPLPDISESRWHTAIREVYPDRSVLGQSMQSIVENLPQYIYRRGGRVYTDEEWAVLGKSARTKQFVLTSSDYCKLYVTVLKFYARRCAREVGLERDYYVHVPVALGLLSRTPYLKFPKVFLSHLYLVCEGEGESRRRVICESLAQLMHGVAVPLGSNSQCFWSLVSSSHKSSSPHQMLLSISDVGLEGSVFEECRPMPSAFTRGIHEVNLRAVLDIIPSDALILCLNVLLLEQKLLLISSKYSCSFIAHLCEALRVLMYPFDWAHVFVPLIPSVDLSASEDNIPYWIESAMTRDHIHPLRVLEAPAPIFAGLRVMRSKEENKSSSSSSCLLLQSLFPDVNIFNIDSGKFLSASQRVDRVNAPLPEFPKKLAAGISTRLMSDNEKWKDKRTASYLKWDETIVPETSRDESMVVQGAILEAFAKLFFPYREFLFVDPLARAVSLGAAGFTGSDRYFLTKQFLKCSDRHQLAGADCGNFLKVFLATQCWDLFVRTSALNPVSSTFDQACCMYASLNKVDYAKFKHFVAATTSSSFLSAASGQQLVAVMTTPFKKSKDYYFDQLIALIQRVATAQFMLYVEPFQLEQDEEDAEDSSEDILEIISRVVMKDLPRNFTDPNLEAYKLSRFFSLSRKNCYSLTELVALRTALPLIRSGKMASHLIHFVLKDTKFVAGNKTRGAVHQAGGTESSVASVWSSSQRQQNDETRLLGGIPRSAIPVRLPQVPTVVVRNWTFYRDEEISFIRYIFGVGDAREIDFQCRNCKFPSSNLLHVLQQGRYFESTLGDFIFSICPNCSTAFSPEILHSSSNFRCKIYPVHRLVHWLQVLPVSLETHLNLSLLLGMQFEIRSANSLRGIVSLVDLLADFNACFSISAQQDEDTEAAAASPTALPAVSSPVRSPSSSDENDHEEGLLSESTTPRKQRHELGSTYCHSRVIKIHVDPPRSANSSNHRRKITSRGRKIKAASSPINHNKPAPVPPKVSQPSPPSDKRPVDAAPRRARKSTTPESFLNDTQLPN